MLIGKEKIPLYLQLAEIIINQIESLDLKEDTQLPTEKEYCEKYKLSRSTVRQAFDYLEKKGYLYKIQGSGTFVSSRRLKQKLLKFYSFSNEMIKQGKKPESKILDFKVININEKLAKELNLDKTEKVFELKRIRLADSEKIMFEETYLPYKKFLGLTREEIEENSLYDILRTKYGLIFSKAIERFSVDLSDEKNSNLLSILKGTPIINLQRWTYVGLEVVEYTVSYVRGDRFEFEVELKEDNNRQ